MTFFLFFLNQLALFYQDNQRLLHITSFLDVRQENCQFQ